jgi:lipoprotein-anchoring transpeptidase ErfK/SrfK
VANILFALVFLSGTLATGAASERGAASFPDKATARIVIDQDRQRMLVYDGGTLIRSLPISSGWPGKRQTLTPEWRGRVGEYWGTFTSFGTTQDDGYWLFTDYLPDGSWNGDILIHGAPYLIGPEGEKEYDLEGIGAAPVSHGCIRLLPGDMAWFRQWDPLGVEVNILPHSAPALTAPRLAAGALLAGGAVPAGAPNPAP